MWEWNCILFVALLLLEKWACCQHLCSCISLRPADEALISQQFFLEHFSPSQQSPNSWQKINIQDNCVGLAGNIIFRGNCEFLYVSLMFQKKLGLFAVWRRCSAENWPRCAKRWGSAAGLRPGSTCLLNWAHHWEALHLHQALLGLLPPFFFLKIYFICSLWWVFVVAHRLSPVLMSRGYSRVVEYRL